VDDYGTVHHDRDPTEFDEAAGFARGNDSIQVRHEQTNEFVIRNVARRHPVTSAAEPTGRANRESLDPWSPTPEHRCQPPRTISTSGVRFPSEMAVAVEDDRHR
jgi:hypothetical protein